MSADSSTPIVRVPHSRLVWNDVYRGVFLRVWGMQLDLVWVTKPFRERGW